MNKKKTEDTESFLGNVIQLVKKILVSPKKLVVVLIILALGSFGWHRLNKNKQQPQYQTVEVERGTIVSSVSASGQVLSVNIMSATTKASGIVKEVYVRDGDLIKAGDKILEVALDLQGQQKNAQAYSSYLSAKNTLESTKATQYSLQATMFEKWDSFKELAEGDDYENSDGSPRDEQRTLPEFHIPKKEWLAAELKYKNQEAIIVQAQAAVNSNWLAYQLSSPVITAPTNGMVTSLMFSKGMSIGTLDTGNTISNQKVATIKTEGMPIVFVNLSEIDVSQVKLEQKATITLDSIGNKTFTGKVIGIDRIGTYISGVTQYPAIIRLDSGAVQILPKMAVTANIIIAVKDNTLLVPSSAVIEQNGQASVRILRNNRQQLTLVKIGLISDTQTEIVSGLEEGETVIVGTFSDGDASGGGSPFSRTQGGFGGMMRGGPPH